jgi:HAD superfamily hydrolase (TIGR01549 family)
MNAPFVFFDIGSTLMDGPPVSPKSRFIRELGLSPDSGELVENILFTEDITTPEALTERMHEAFPGLPENAEEIIKNIWNAQIEEGWEVEGSRDVISLFESNGWRIGLISNIWHPYYECFKRLYSDILDRFETITLSYKSGCRKPGQDIYKSALESIKIKNTDASDSETPVSKVAMVGDSYTQDILPALQMGLKTVWFLREHEREADNLRQIILGQAPLPTLAVSDLTELSGKKLDYLKMELSESME